MSLDDQQISVTVHEREALTRFQRGIMHDRFALTSRSSEKKSSTSLEKDKADWKALTGKSTRERVERLEAISLAVDELRLGLASARVPRGRDDLHSVAARVCRAIEFPIKTAF